MVQIRAWVCELDCDFSIFHFRNSGPYFAANLYAWYFEIFDKAFHKSMYYSEIFANKILYCTLALHTWNKSLKAN